MRSKISAGGRVMEAGVGRLSCGCWVGGGPDGEVGSDILVLRHAMETLCRL